MSDFFWKKSAKYVRSFSFRTGPKGRKKKNPSERFVQSAKDVAELIQEFKV